jgi:chorismate synthase
MFYTQDEHLDQRIKERVDAVRQAGDTLGGIFEVTAFRLPPGLGTHAGWECKLDGLLARALMSVQTVKGVEIGLGFGAARLQGSQMHDEIVLQDGTMQRTRNNAGGIEGGMTNGQPLVARAACKPISTLRTPLKTVDLQTKEETSAQYERSDVTVVPAASVIGEAVVSFELARAFLDKFGGDTWEETRERFDAYRSKLARFGTSP